MPRTRRAVLVLFLIAVSGCASFSSKLIDPNTGDVQACSYTGWGRSGARQAGMEHALCVRTFQKLGYREVGR